MNKIKIVVIVLLLLSFLLGSTALATSGACSGHGGVNCAVGADGDGSVVCKDGWLNSSVSYSSMKMCAGYATTPKPRPVTPPIRKAEPVRPTPKPIEHAQGDC